jgi:GNAT superfamily N-acetyltransferase
VTGSPGLTLRPATFSDVETLATVLARAFYDDPPLAWLLPNPATRLARISRVFATIIGIEALRYGGVDIACVEGKVIGGAIWLPPGRWRPGLQVQVQALPRHLVALRWQLLNRGARMDHVLKDAHPKEQHWYLEAIGVDPGWQGQKVASLLLRSRLRRCDREGQPAYLEASRPGGVPLYEHFGFRPTVKLALPQGGPVITAMWRGPANPSANADCPRRSTGDVGPGLS